MPNKSSPDDINVLFLKNCFCLVLSKPLLNMVNTSLQNCQVPNSFKPYTNIPIPKVKNFIQTVLEKVVNHQIVGFNSENILVTCAVFGHTEGSLNH